MAPEVYRKKRDFKRTPAPPGRVGKLKRKDLRYDHFNVKSVVRRIARIARDPWQDFFLVRQSITRSMMDQVGFAPGSPAPQAGEKRRGRWRR